MCPISKGISVSMKTLTSINAFLERQIDFTDTCISVLKRERDIYSDCSFFHLLDIFRCKSGILY